MTQLLERAIAKVTDLAPADQDAIAAMILDELKDEQRWTASFARSQDALARLAEKVRKEIAAGQTREMGIDEL